MEAAKLSIDNEIDDLCNRMDEHYSNILDDLRNDARRLKDTLDRAYLDHKLIDRTLYQLRVPWTKGITVAGGAVTFNPSSYDYADALDGSFDFFQLGM